MNIATADNLPAQSNRAVSNPWRIARGVIWGSLAVVVLSGWFVVTRVGLRQDLRVWDVMALRFGEGALFLTPVLLVGPLRLRVQAWPSGIILALLWGAPFILLVGLGLQATSVTMTSTVTPALMPVFAGFVAWTFFGERPSRRQLSGLRNDRGRAFRLALRLCPSSGPPGHGRCCGSCNCRCSVGGLYTTAAPSRRYVPSSSCAHLLLVGHPLSAALPRIQPFEPDARVRRRARVSVDLSGNHDDRGCALCLQSRRRFARTPCGSCDYCTCAGHDDPLGDTGSRRIAIMAVGSRHLHHCAGVGLAASSSNQGNKKGERE